MPNNPSLKQDKITGVLYKHPFSVTAFLVLVVLIATGMQLKSGAAACVVQVCGYLLIIGYGIYLKQTKRLTPEALIVLIFAMGFVLRLGYVLYTDIATRQNDAGIFEEGNYNYFHSGYILYIRDHLALPAGDVSKMGEYYHPPFHHIVCAAFLKIYELFLPKGKHNYESLQALSLLWANFSVIVLYKDIKLIGINRESCPIVAALISAAPICTILSGSINNDNLSVLLMFTAIYFGLKWFKEGGIRNIVLSALATGFGMMTKLAVGLIAFSLGFLFIVKLIKDIRGRKEGLRTFLNLVVFGVICAPLGLWFEIRNYLNYKVPVTYVLLSDNIYQDVSRYTPAQRLFGFYGFPIEDYYINLGSDGQQDYNIFITLIKTGLFGEENCRDDFLMSITGYILLLIFLVVIAVAAAGMIYTVLTLKKRDSFWEDISMVIMCVTQIISLTMFAFKYPHICSIHFRFTMMLALCGAVFFARISGIKLKGSNKDLITKITGVIAAAFFILAIIFYTILWTYVKGEVTVVDVTW